MCFLTSCAQVNTQQTQDYYKLFSVKGEYQDIRDELIRTIEDKGMVISFISHAGNMLKRTQNTATVNGNLYENAEIILFCKAELSHELSASDVHSLILCPQAIAIYTLKNQPQTVYMSIRKGPEKAKAYAPIFQLLTQIIKQVIEENE
jgi:uncharacterized protein (DUF302 family)